MLDASLLRHRRAIVAVVAVLVVAAVACVVLAKITDLFPGPAGLRPWITRPTLPASTRGVVDAFAWLGRPVPALVTVVALGVASAATAGPRWAALALAAPAVVLLTTAMKDVGPETSLPSGHAAYAFATFGFASWIALRAGRRALAAGAAFIGIGMGPARIIEGAHWPADVIVGDA